MELEKHKDSKKKIERTQRNQKTLKKIKRFISFNILGSIRTF
jgi:hypothetical protein